MTTARNQLISVDATPYYHCVSRCVRKSYLCGKDHQANVSYEHRRDWIEDKLRSLSRIYCIDICAYAIMSNHYHLVVHINREKARELSSQEVVARWSQEHKLPNLIQCWKANLPLSQIETQKCETLIEKWRKRLWSLSWFMKELNFDIACRANKEDNCRGHFWESRFKSQALLDEKALLAAMAYVDLNPVRAGIAATPESSDFTSIKARVNALARNQPSAPNLYPFVGNEQPEHLDGLPFKLIDYIQLVDWTARQMRPTKITMDQSIPPILERIAIQRVVWLRACSGLEKTRATAIGLPDNLALMKAQLKKAKVHLFSL